METSKDKQLPTNYGLGQKDQDDYTGGFSPSSFDRKKGNKSMTKAN